MDFIKLPRIVTSFAWKYKQSWIQHFRNGNRHAPIESYSPQEKLSLTLCSNTGASIIIFNIAEVMDQNFDDEDSAIQLMNTACNKNRKGIYAVSESGNAQACHGSLLLLLRCCICYGLFSRSTDGSSFGEKLKKAISDGEMVNVNLDWRESVPHLDDRVEYELWTNSNDECGVKCDMLMDFVKNFKGAAQILEKGGYTLFTPHYITCYCPQAFTISKQCKSQCINHGRYCAPDPEQDFSSGYEGKDVVIENLRQLCVFKVANESSKPWVWWDYVTDFQIRCPMKEKKYNKECADAVIKSLGLDLRKIEKCMGDPNADSDNPLLKEEQDAQVSCL
ncbi:hypothetical protein M8C21_028149 [Ambrosia artemisiifolia]|uniref:Vacuolar sorting receptor thioredoxin-like domain-containing protein n=1 Tax=Ambrosia artemisiifolia TaxID=4212 RepID=A0AAD5CZN8_AMBAR|nr:hypothetical protein M8C21_028149 [Ambrosia artemisiifolia]